MKLFFKKPANIMRLATVIMWFVFAIIKSIQMAMAETVEWPSYVTVVAGFLAGLFMLISLVISYLRVKRNNFDDMDNMDYDERAMFIAGRTALVTLLVMIALALIAVIVLKILNIMPAVFAIGGIVIVTFIVYAIISIIFSKKM